MINSIRRILLIYIASIKRFNYFKTIFRDNIEENHLLQVLRVVVNSDGG